MGGAEDVEIHTRLSFYVVAVLFVCSFQWCGSTVQDSVPPVSAIREDRSSSFFHLAKCSLLPVDFLYYEKRIPLYNFSFFPQFSVLLPCILLSNHFSYFCFLDLEHNMPTILHQLPKLFTPPLN